MVQRWVDTIEHDGGEELQTDSLMQGVFVLRREPETHSSTSTAKPSPGQPAQSARPSRRRGARKVVDGDACVNGSETVNTTQAQSSTLAFPALVVDEDPAAGAARAQAFQAAWAHVQSKIQAVQERSHRGAMQQVGAYLTQVAWKRQSDAIHAGGVPNAIAHALPTGLVLAGGVNSADHAGTFDALAQFLRGQGNTVALIRSQSLRNQGSHYGLGSVLQCILSQISGQEQHENIDMRPLEAWHRRRARAGEAATGPGAERPVVILLEDTECVDGEVLGDLALALSESGASFPSVLLLGLATSIDFLQAILPADAAARLRPTVFRLTSAMDCLEDFQREVLLEGAPTVALGHAVLKAMSAHFTTHDFSVAALRRSMRAALLMHFSQQPLAHLAMAAAGGEAALLAACSALTPSMLKYARKELRSLKLAPTASTREVVESLVAALSSSPARYRAWVVGVKVLCAAAAAAGIAHRAATLRELLRDASSATFLANVSPPAQRTQRNHTSEGEAFVAELVDAVEKLKAPHMDTLLQELECLVAQLPSGGDGGDADLVAQLQSLRRNLVCAHQQEEERTQASAAAAAEARTRPPPAPLNARERLAQQAAREQEERESPMAVAAQLAATAARGTSSANKRRAILAAVARSSNDPKQVVKEARTGIGAFLQLLVDRCLRTPPEAFPAHEVTCFAEAKSMQAILHAAPRPFLERSLRAPQVLLQCRCCPTTGRVSNKLPDTTLVYLLMDSHGEFVDVQEWFQAFYEHHPTPQQKTIGQFFPTQNESIANTKKRGQNAAKTTELSGTPHTAQPVDPKHLEAVQARFTRAAAELQFLGLVRPTKRRRGDFVQRMAFETPMTTEESDAAAAAIGGHM